MWHATAQSLSIVWQIACHNGKDCGTVRYCVGSGNGQPASSARPGRLVPRAASGAGMGWRSRERLPDAISSFTLKGQCGQLRRSAVEPVARCARHSRMRAPVPSVVALPGRIRPAGRPRGHAVAPDITSTHPSLQVEVAGVRDEDVVGAPGRPSATGHASTLGRRPTRACSR
jgi:hypothetical protein